mmetsp:Transcript_146603/g.258328  ORF Transcript_146603/g.258328 Transcript_146603/m.258328 type:complete len:217 (-) Transcript_146603:377-1027(-)
MTMPDAPRKPSTLKKPASKLLCSCCPTLSSTAVTTKARSESTCAIIPIAEKMLKYFKGTNRRRKATKLRTNMCVERSEVGANMCVLSPAKIMYATTVGNRSETKRSGTKIRPTLPNTIVPSIVQLRLLHGIPALAATSSKAPMVCPIIHIVIVITTDKPGTTKLMAEPPCRSAKGSDSTPAPTIQFIKFSATCIVVCPSDLSQLSIGTASRFSALL